MLNPYATNTSIPLLDEWLDPVPDGMQRAWEWAAKRYPYSGSPGRKVGDIQDDLAWSYVLHWQTTLWSFELYEFAGLAPRRASDSYPGCYWAAVFECGGVYMPGFVRGDFTIVLHTLCFAEYDKAMEVSATLCLVKNLARTPPNQNATLELSRILTL